MQDWIVKNWKRCLLYLIAFMVALIIAIHLGKFISAFIKSCPEGQQKINGTCIAKDKPEIAPSDTSSPLTRIDLSTTYEKLADVPDVPAMLVQYGGSTTLAPLRCDRTKEQPDCRDPKNNLELRILQAHPKFNLTYTAPPFGVKPGSSTGIRMLLKNKLSFSHSSRPIEKEDFEGTQDNVKLEDYKIAIDGIVIYVDEKVSKAIPGLTLSQLQDIYTCKRTSWRDFNGPDLLIVPFSRDPKYGGTPELFKKEFLKEEFGACVSQEKSEESRKGEGYSYSTTESIRKVANTTGGIGYASASEVCYQDSVSTLAIAKGDREKFVPACLEKQVNKDAFRNASYPVSRPVFVIIRRDGTLDEKAGIAYVRMALSKEGQELIGKAGFGTILQD